MNRITIIMVAHRVTTLRGCDRVVELEGGRISRIGEYADFVARVEPFSRPAGRI